MTVTEGPTTHSSTTINEATKSQRIEEVESHATKALDTTMPRSIQSSTRSARPRINTNRTRPYHDSSTRPKANRKLSAPCRYFNQGNCIAGDTCRYQHILAPATTATEDLDQELLAFVNDDEPVSPQEPGTTSSTGVAEGSTLEPEIQSDDEELDEIIPYPDACMAEVRYHSVLNPSELRTYFVAQRQTVIEYEGNNVGILSGGVLLGVPGARKRADTGTTEASNDASDPCESETASSSPSSVSNGSDVELWKGPVNFDEVAPAERLVWADEDIEGMEGIEPTDCSYTPPVSTEMLPTPPPIIRRIIRSAEHNRRHSLS